MNAIQRLLGILLVAGLVSCSPTKYITYDYDAETDFSHYASFDWLAPPGHIEDPLISYPSMALTIKKSIERELIGKGFDKVDEDPDFYVVYHASVERQLTRSYIDTWGYYYPRYHRYPRYRRYPPVAWGFVYVDAYEEGTLVIDIVDAGTNELVWRGSARGAVGDPVLARSRIDEAVSRILAPFPPIGREEAVMREAPAS
ncbi:MAG: DUF4136 domain-containing protein [Rhodothermales bacterium]